MVVGDIDRGGILAALFGTWALLDEDDRALLKAFCINKFRGDESVLTPGLEEITRRTGVPFVGVLPWLEDVWLDSEDALSIGRWRPSQDGIVDRLSVAVVRFPRTSNATDVDALAAEPGVDVRVTTDADVCREADLLVLPGSRATVSDLAWLREQGWPMSSSNAQPPTVRCWGSVVATRCWPPRSMTPSRAGPVSCPVWACCRRRSPLRARRCWAGRPTPGADTGSRATRSTTASSTTTAFPGGMRREAVFGSIWHGTLEGDDFRRAFLADVAALSGSLWQSRPGAAGFAQRRSAMIDALADAVEEHLDLDALLALTARE